MKKLLLILLIIPRLCFSQSIDQIIDNKINTKLNLGFETVEISTYNIAGPFIIDTLDCPLNEIKFYTLKLWGLNGSSFMYAVKDVIIQNKNGTISIESNKNTVALKATGLEGISWDCILINKRAVIQIKGTPFVTKWILRKEL